MFRVVNFPFWCPLDRWPLVLCFVQTSSVFCACFESQECGPRFRFSSVSVSCFCRFSLKKFLWSSTLSPANEESYFSWCFWFVMRDLVYSVFFWCNSFWDLEFWVLKFRVLDLIFLVPRALVLKLFYWVRPRLMIRMKWLRSIDDFRVVIWRESSWCCKFLF